jgi:hypothetical protein
MDTHTIWKQQKYTNKSPQSTLVHILYDLVWLFNITLALHPNINSKVSIQINPPTQTPKYKIVISLK